MPLREKRAAATRAHSKIKIHVLQDLSNENKENRFPNTNKKSRRLSSNDDRGGFKSSVVFDFDADACMPHQKRRPSVVKKRRCKKSEGSRPRLNQAGASELGSTKPSRQGDLVAGPLRSTSDRNSRKKVEMEISTDEKARMEHQRRRSLRLINSTGPMLLSYRTSYRMEKNMSPECSPINSCRLRFTPVAHLPTTPVVPYRHGSPPKSATGRLL